MQEGRLDDQGRAVVQPPVDGQAVVHLGEDARPWTPHAQPTEPNPDHRPSLDKAQIEQLARRIEQGDDLAQKAQEADPGIGAWIWGVLQGDFNENPTATQTLVGGLITMIPVIDQIADVRDVIACLLMLADEEDDNNNDAWISLVITLIGIIPVFGSAIKGVFKLLWKHTETTVDVVLALLRKLGYGDPVKFLRELDWSDLARQSREAFHEAVGRMQAVLEWLTDSAPARWALDDDTLKGLRELHARIQRLASQADARIDEAIDALHARVDALLDGLVPARKAQVKNGQETQIRTHELALPYEPHPRAVANGPKVEGAPIFKRRHKDGTENDPYTLMPDGKPMGAERGKMPKELYGMKDLPARHEEYVARGWPSLERTNRKGEIVAEYENFLDADPSIIPEGTKIYRIVDEMADDGGSWWAFGLPKSKTEWRRDYAIKDSWNDDGYYVEYTVLKGGLKAWTGKAAGQQYHKKGEEQFYLPGGKEQIYVEAGSIMSSEPKLTNWPEP